MPDDKVNIDDPEVFKGVISHIETEADNVDTTLAGRPTMQDSPASGMKIRDEQEAFLDQSCSSPGGKRLDVTKLSVEQVKILMARLPAMQRSGHRGVFHWIYEKTVGAYRRRKLRKALASMPWRPAVWGEGEDSEQGAAKFVEDMRSAGTKAYQEYVKFVETRVPKTGNVAGNQGS